MNLGLNIVFVLFHYSITSDIVWQYGNFIIIKHKTVSNVIYLTLVEHSRLKKFGGELYELCMDTGWAYQ